MVEIIDENQQFISVFQRTATKSKQLSIGKDNRNQLVLKRVAPNRAHLTGFSRLLARHALRLGLVDREESITKSSGREKSAFGGPNQSISVVAKLARSTRSRYVLRLAE